MSHTERIDPDTTARGILALHLKRYDFARQFCAGAEALDAACGAGYGSAHLAPVATRVVGVDVDARAVEHARSRYVSTNLEFRVGDVQSLDDPSGIYGVVCSFETIEHVDDPDRALQELTRVLAPDGTLVISTPSAKTTTASPENPFHRCEWSAGDFEQLLRGYFDAVELYGQHRVQTSGHRLMQRLDVLGLRRRLAVLRRASRLLGTVPTADLTLDDVLIERGLLDGASAIVAVCTRPRR